MSQNDVFQRMITAFEDIPVIDTHEHLPGRAEFRDMEADVLTEYLRHYFSVDIRTSGMPPADYHAVTSPGLSIMSKWKLIEPWWEQSRHTGYGRALDRSVEILYGLPGINKGTIEELNICFRTSLGDPLIYQSVLKDKCHIKTAILDEITGHSLQGDPRFFREIYRFDTFIRPNSRRLNEVETKIGRKIDSMDTWLESFDQAYTELFEDRNVVGIKCGLAYERSLYFPETTRGAAERAFRVMLKRSAESPDWTAPPDFENYMMHYMLAKAQTESRILQIHTGILEGNGNHLANCDPMLLNNLFQKYDNITFDLFHIGYPFQHKLLALVKMYPHVFADLCWTNIIAPGAVVRFIEDFIDTVPVNKLSAFGGDYLFPDAVLGHLAIAKENTAAALSCCVERKIFDRQKAVEIGRQFFYDNPKRIFRL